VISQYESFIPSTHAYDLIGESVDDTEGANFLNEHHDAQQAVITIHEQTKIKFGF